MEKFKNTLKSVNKSGLFALVMVAFATMAFMPSKNLAVKKWAYNPSAPTGSQWTDITGQQQSGGGVIRDYSCTNSQTTCTAEFEENQNPNSNPSNPTNVVLGNFTLEDN